MAGNIAAATQHITMLSHLAAQHRFPWMRFEHCLRGALLIKCGEAAEGSTLLRSGLEEFGSAGQTLHGSGFVLDFATALASLGNLEEASAVVDTALARSKHEGVLWHAPELLRMK